MRILQTIASFGAKSGGTSTCTYDLIKALVDNQTHVELLTSSVIDPFSHSCPQIYFGNVWL